MKIKTSELTGAALDWAVAKCEGNTITFADDGLPSGQWEMYSSNWAQGGPIIEREGITTRESLVDAMRCYVASKLGDEVDIPGELLQ